jgi:predicted transcriptional regulator
VDSKKDLMKATAEIVAAYLSKNAAAPAEIPALIKLVHTALAALDQESPSSAAVLPAVPVEQSVTPDYIVCLEDGKKLKMLKRYLKTAYGLTPEQYREKWGLPPDYPMVAPNYAEKRSSLAKKYGLGIARSGKG